ncbi:MAG TPA: DUF362 domain-containing protein [Bacteroidota bacterium]|nr:DUF362 domain-containing protein [Bacteroidota bacterium]
MIQSEFTRRDFLKAGIGVALSAASAPLVRGAPRWPFATEKFPVSIVKVKNDRIGSAVEEAIDLLGGMQEVARGKERILLKPNLVSESPDCTTKREVIKTLAELMKSCGKDVCIGEGSAAAGGFNSKQGEVYRTKNTSILDGMQKYVFDQLGYTDLARLLDIPLINLHCGEMVDVSVPDAYAYRTISLHRSLSETDLLCSVPMMKTHVLATVTLGMKNLIGLYAGRIYGSVRAGVHDHAARAGSRGVAFEIVDMVRANKLGLVVVDGSTAMEGNGPMGGGLVKMGVIVAGTNPLATDMVAARLMGFRPEEIPTFAFAQKAGMEPSTLEEVEVRGESISEVERSFKRPELVSWESINRFWGVKELQ